MGQMKETINENELTKNEYVFIDENKEHIHTYLGKPLLGASTVTGVLAKPLTWWASGLACEKFGWMNKGNAKTGWTSIGARLQKATEYQDMIGKLSPENYLELLDEAYSAHSKKLDSSAKSGTDLHAELERYVKWRMGKLSEANPVFDSKIQPFIDWANVNVKRFLWSELHCYSEKLWVGGISDCGVELNDGRMGIIDFKSSKDSYESQFIQCAGYDILISENGGFTNNGYKIFELEKPLDFYAIVPFGSPEFKVDFRYNVVMVRSSLFSN